MYSSSHGNDDFLGVTSFHTFKLLTHNNCLSSLCAYEYTLHFTVTEIGAEEVLSPPRPVQW